MTTKKDRKKLALYVHIPFCVKKCFYCDFLSGPSTNQEKKDYVNALIKEIRSYESQERWQQYQVTSIFIGGGTPSSIDATEIERILATICEVFQVSTNDISKENEMNQDEIEITIEINPGTTTKEKLECYKKAGINRISFGLQSTNNEELKSLGRIHSYEEFVLNYELARKVGFENINIDLMTSLPGQTPEKYMESLEKIVALNPEHISAYSLIIEEGTPFYELYGESEHCKESVNDRKVKTCQETSDSCVDDWCTNDSSEQDSNLLHTGRVLEAYRQNKGLTLPSEEEDRYMYELTKEFLHQHGYERYEISNYAKIGRECKHNLAYWRRQDYIGFGCGASSLFEEVRFKNLEATEDYIHMVNHMKDRKELRLELQELSEEEQMEEFMFLGFRVMEGIDQTVFESYFHRSLDSVYQSVLEKLIKEELIEKHENRYRLTSRGIDISNYVLSEFIMD